MLPLVRNRTLGLYSDDGYLIANYSYTSGVNGVTDPSIANQGPTPPGHYTLDTSQISEGGLIRSLLGDWGNYRAPLKPVLGTNTHGRDRFFIHGGKKPGSKGCIDVGENDTDLFGRLTNVGGIIDVFVGPY